MKKALFIIAIILGVIISFDIMIPQKKESYYPYVLYQNMEVKSEFERISIKNYPNEILNGFVNIEKTYNMDVKHAIELARVESSAKGFTGYNYTTVYFDNKNKWWSVHLFDGVLNGISNSVRVYMDEYGRTKCIVK